ncbi:MAG: type II toxin-antitoxin system VapC family toxin [Pseudomonadota bacterium]
MRLLLDTHIYLWVLKGDRKLSKAAHALIQNASKIYISSISIWEAAIKTKLGKLDVDINNLIGAISLSGFSELPLTAKHMVEFDRLPNLHRDPFDRILIAQAISEPLRLLTVDKMLKKYSALVEII